MLADVAELPTVREVRQRGFMVGIELTDFPLDARMGHQVALEARSRGAIVRPLGDVVVLMPPLAISEGELTTARGDHRASRSRQPLVRRNSPPPPDLLPCWALR